MQFFHCLSLRSCPLPLLGTCPSFFCLVSRVFFSICLAKEAPEACGREEDLLGVDPSYTGDDEANGLSDAPGY